ncbi:MULTISPECIES: helix-turn-helix transcriptional regulator [Micromonospora]|uniref:helix-turn-helix transcriptional regulator n=1 Tax=Micromonospora TaxID=1873 RepID=UPI001E2C2F02|nr:helix-turn-helix domain-containing protein [Micromonospora yangpuensis]
MPRHPLLRVMGAAEIAEYLGVSRQWVEVLSKRRDFPEPSATLKAGRIWRTEDIEQWAAEHRPQPEPDESS